MLGISKWVSLFPQNIEHRNDFAYYQIGLDRWYYALVEVDQGLSAIAKALESHSLIEISEVDGFAMGGATPNDPRFSVQWGLHNDGTFNSIAISGADVQAQEAWDIATGSSDVVIAVLDSGSNLTEPDLLNNLWVNPGEIHGNGIDDDNNGFVDDIHGYDFVNDDGNPDDDHGHGTNVAGIIGAIGNNGVGFTGACWNCSIMSGKNLNDQNSGSNADFAASVIYAVDNGAHLINMSGGGSGTSTPLKDSVVYAYQTGVPIIACMMNSDSDVAYYPAAYPEVIAVGATDSTDFRASPFSWGGGSSFGKHIDVSAPGNEIYGLSTTDSNYSYSFSGTSHAASLTTGLAALLLSVNPSLNQNLLQRLIAKGAEDQVGSIQEDTPGWDQYHGYGRINFYESLLLAEDVDGDGVSVEEGDCDDNDPELNHDDFDNDGFTTCPQQTCFTATLDDSYGDGWNDGFLTVMIDGEWGYRLFASGYQSTTAFCIPSGQDFELIYTPGLNDSDNSYTILDSQGNVVLSDGPSPLAGSVYSNAVEFGLTDCDDFDEMVYPFAPEVCDGLYNNCADGAYSATGAPADETDDDGDGFVDCDDGEYIDDAGCVCETSSFVDCFDSTGATCSPNIAAMVEVVWAGAEPGYADCNDANATVYPWASEQCDGIFNDCNNFLYPGNNSGVYSGVVGNCYCAVIDTDNDNLADKCDASDCVDDSGAACTPENVDINGYVEYCEIADTTGSAFFGSTYFGVEADCYCPGYDCQLDVTSDTIVDCFTPIGGICTAHSDSSGYAQDCASNIAVTIDVAFQFNLGAQITIPFNEMDNDGDNYVECNYIASLWSPMASTNVVGGADCDDSDDTVHPTATEACDGQFNDCGSVIVGADAPSDETDNDGDGYVECTIDILGWDGTAISGGDDCNDTVSVVYPGAPEVCDGLYNDCLDSAYSMTSAPAIETDDDGDGYVECLYDATSWLGSSTVIGGSDCDDSDALSGAPTEEICDGIFNDCNHPHKDFFNGVISDCYCPSADCMIDINGDQISDCVDSAGDTCTPDSDDGVYANDCNEMTTAVSIAGADYFGAEVECYCPTESCQLDSTGDGVVDCVTPVGQICPAEFRASNTNDEAELCVGSGATPHLFLKPDGTPLDAPMDETDHDGDGFVECEFFLETWNGNLGVIGGLDCDDVDATIYNGATEECDGQINDCNTVGLPEIEVDGDSDGFVDCTIDVNGWDGDPITGGDDCNDTVLSVYPGAVEVCDGQYNNCEAAGYSALGAPLDETDNDGDSQVECANNQYLDGNGCFCSTGIDTNADGVVDSYSNCVDVDGLSCVYDVTSLVLVEWMGVNVPNGYNDCDDTNAVVYDSAPEDCDGVFNDCNHPQKSDFEGVISDCYCPTMDCTIDNNGDNLSDCIDSTGNTCTPESADGVHADYCNTPSSPISIGGTNYYSVEAACYCPESDCLLDTTGDGAIDCITPTGETCPAEFRASNSSGEAELCVGSSATSYTFVKTDGSSLDAPMHETDHDDDDYVECEYIAASWVGNLGIIGGDDCNDTDDTVYPLAAEICDGQFNNCSDSNIEVLVAPLDEADVDSDGYVECQQNLSVQIWAGETEPVGYSDCDDQSSSVYPSAIEICDGQYNDCDAAGYVSSGAPLVETDNDSDGQVECLDGQYLDSNGCLCQTATDTDFDGVVDTFTDCVDTDDNSCVFDSVSLALVEWLGATVPDGYNDCNDNNSAVYADVAESCDGIFNDCNHPQLSPFEGLVSDCYCPVVDTDFDGAADACSVANCVDLNGATCNPIDEDTDLYVDDGNCFISSTPETINGIDYYGAEIDCFCPTSDCEMDVLNNNERDCLDSVGQICQEATDAAGFAEDCATGFTVNHIFVESDGDPIERPYNESDNDNDGYVECTGWGGSSFTILGGDDCDDTDAAVFPGATEVCDGQFNDCNDTLYSAAGAPDNEIDNDSDNWIECVRATNVVWAAYNGSPEPNIEGFGTDGSGSTSRCVCYDSSCTLDCKDINGATCLVSSSMCQPVSSTTVSDCDDEDIFAFPYSAENEYDDSDGIGPELCMRDHDQDGYGDSTPSNIDVVAGHDCNDENPYIHPQQNEICESEDQVDSDCNGDVNTANTGDGFVLDGALMSLYIDNDNDGFGDPNLAAVPACEVDSGYVFNATDCDDSNPAVNPIHHEVCDGIDNDCDQTIDDLPIDGNTWYLDSDADGYGGATMMISCSSQPPSGYTAVGSDCNDNDSSINPDGVEICDQIDNNCDSQVDENISLTWYSDSDNDGFGDSTISVQDCQQPTGFVDNAEDCNDGDGNINPNAVETCDEIDNNCDSQVDEGLSTSNWYRDSDNDGFGDPNNVTQNCLQPIGYVVNASDCNDGDGSINPNALEICDQIDNNCDTQIDENPGPAWYQDADNDGYGDSTNSVQDCQQPIGFVANSSDCNDGQSDINPDAVEICDQIDNDCDSQVDDGVSTLSWFADSDNDGYGDPAGIVENCEQPDGYVSNALDCDDSMDSINPTIEEICDGIDNNCDSQVDEGISALTWFNDADNDGYGDPAMIIESCQQPDGYVSNALDCNDESDDINPAIEEVCDQIDNNCDSNIDEGFELRTWYPDLDSDGYGDEENGEEGCSQPNGYVANGDDCDDDDDELYPNAPGYDQQCQPISSDDSKRSGCNTTARGFAIDGFFLFLVVLIRRQQKLVSDGLEMLSKKPESKG